MAVDRKKIVDELSKITIEGNADGLIPAYNVLMTQLPGEFWNTFNRKIMDSVSEDLKEAAWALLYNASHECGYHTCHGIISSEEWKAVVQPMVESKEDIIHGGFAVLAAWGWGNAEIIELVPNQKLIVRAHEYYESDVCPEKNSPYVLAPLLTGVSAALMDLAYSEAYPDGLQAFIAKQTKGVEKGDEYGEFVVNRQNDDVEISFLS